MFNDGADNVFGSGDWCRKVYKTVRSYRAASPGCRHTIDGLLPFRSIIAMAVSGRYGSKAGLGCNDFELTRRQDNALEEYM